ncbi:hypothetical protein J8L98_01430 [Pseudoalteromonas sp. MMG013]|uniref:hypothetical protein n=1 Tax=Pseudoalteromonas sp. MMG013 TaxID=2822687 RepID=UPI001B35EDBB|nr:hypothetical protein [Pseudoalteromonas sp. MMG013]MBQ4860350.1 hypothetical protein [Pseudoalteromonas sp. MMG013]
MTDFKQLLFRAGFMNFGKLDRKGAAKFMYTTERTLDRWITTNKPCPRAVHMLNSRIDGIISNRKEWNGFHICRDGYLWTPRGHRYDALYLNKIDFLQRSNRMHESNAATLQMQIDHLQELVEASDVLKSMGNDLIAMSDKFRFKQAVMHYRAKKEKSA